MHPAQLRSALSRHLGQVLVPQVAARIEAEAVWNPMPLPEACGDVTNEQRPEFYDFANERLSASYEPHNTRLLTRVTGGAIRAVVVFCDPRRWSIEMAVASDGSSRWLSRAFLRAAFRYPFVQLGLPRVTGRIQADNLAALALDAHLGFRHEGIQRAQFGDQDAVLMGMLASECRWLGEQPC
jgi:hypothetical protein